MAALYVDPRGPYPSMQGVEAWDEARDATRYPGPFPVVAHPPCGPWGILRHLYQGGGAELAPLAVEQVRKFGGVLEHPRGSLLFKQMLPRPGCSDAWGYTVEVCQVDFGHVARKRTWLYMVGVPRGLLSFPPPREPTHWVAGGRNAARGSMPPGIKACSVALRRRTPLPFARWLVELARGSSV